MDRSKTMHPALLTLAVGALVVVGLWLWSEQQPPYSQTTVAPATWEAATRGMERPGARNSPTRASSNLDQRTVGAGSAQAWKPTASQQQDPEAVAGLRSALKAWRAQVLPELLRCLPAPAEGAAPKLVEVAFEQEEGQGYAVRDITSEAGVVFDEQTRRCLDGLRATRLEIAADTLAQPTEPVIIERLEL